MTRYGSGTRRAASRKSRCTQPERWRLSLFDNSAPGDGRLATKAEWEIMFAGGFQVMWFLLHPFRLVPLGPWNQSTTEVNVIYLPDPGFAA